MSIIRNVLCALVLVHPLARVAAADPALARDTIKESIKIEEDRAKELDGMAKHDETLAKDIDNLVKVRERFAADAEARAKKIRESLSGPWPANSEADKARKALEKFAAAYDEFAKHDHEQAAKRKQAADILAEQAREGAEAAKKHREHAGELRDRLKIMDVR
jgi:hypothetical protein